MLPAAVATTVSITSSVDGSPIDRASVTARTAAGTVLQRSSDRNGIATLPGDIVRIRVLAEGCRPFESRGREPRAVHVTLTCAPAVIGSVSVATGSSESLHRLPVAASVLDRRAIANSPALFSDELLRALPGFDRNRSNSAFTNYGQLRVSLGGAGADRGLVFADGIPAQDGFGGQIDWAEYPVSDITRVELLRGAGSALYGAGAIGGVVELRTFSPPTLPSERTGTLGVTAGSHGSMHEYATAGVPVGRGLAASIALDREQLSYADLPPAYASPIDQPAQARTSMESLRLRYHPNGAAIVDIGYRTAFDYQQEGRPNYDFWRRLSQEHLRVRLPDRSALIDINGYVRNAYVTNRADVYPQAPGTLRYTQEVPTSERGASFAWTIDHPAATFVARADMRSMYGDSLQYGGNGAFQSGGSGNQQLDGLALQQTLRFHHAEIVAGARADEVRFANGQSTSGGVTTMQATRVDRALSPRLGIRYDLGPKLAARMSIGGGFRAPFLNELVRGYQIGSVVYEPNAHLLPERSASRSIGLDYLDRIRHISLDYTQTGVSDAIMFRTIDPTHQMRSNIDRTQTDGMTLAYEQSVGVCARLTGSLTDQYARIVGGTAATVGKRLQYVPAIEATLGLDATLGSIHTGLTVAYLGQTYADDLNLHPLGTAVVAGIHATAPLGRGVRMIAGIENLTGARYLSSIDRYGMPTILSVGIELPLAKAPSTATPARCK